ncbi:MAG: peptide MFS transporter [Bacteroidales bacterium]|jgi:POT family proton-dependent oligopeptide transporter
MDNKGNKELFGHPVGLYLVSFTAIWERFSYYGMRAFLILYMINDISKPGNADARLGGLGIPEGYAGIIYGIFTGMCYLLALPGGIVADRYLGKRRSIIVGSIFIIFGLFTLAFNNGQYMFFVGLSLLAIGNGFFKPAAPALIGDLYEQGDKRKDSAFTIFYTLFNGGACLAPIICGIFAEEYAYKYGFLIAGTGMVTGLLAYLLAGQKLLGDTGKHVVQKQDKENKIEKIPLTKEEKDRIRVIFIIIFFVTFFWMGFEQAGSTFNIFSKNFIDRTIGSWEVPNSWFQSINPLFILALGTVFSAIWLFLAKRDKNPSIPAKMGYGTIILGAGFLFMIGAILQRGGENPDVTIKANMLWVVATYFFHTIAELFVSPIGLSMISRLAPQSRTSFFMGIWFVSIFLANTIGGFMVGFANQFGYFAVYLTIAIYIVSLGLIMLLLSKKLLAMTHGKG